MGTQNGLSSNRFMNGNSDFIPTQIWRHRISGIKVCVFGLFFLNLIYFAMRYVELTQTVKKLEMQKHLNCPEKTVVNKVEEKETKKSEKEGPLLNYSQVTDKIKFSH